MKITPTETDRLAAQLFAPAGGMRAAWRGERNGVRPVWERLRDGSEATPDFYDTDDGPTQGAMLAQVEAAAGTDCVVTHGTMVEPAGELKWKVRKANGFDLHVLGNVFGPTRGAALVAAKRALAEAAK